jgi:hypothetical protein
MTEPLIEIDEVRAERPWRTKAIPGFAKWFLVPCRDIPWP